MSRSILLADDSATIRKVVELCFDDTDFRVEAVGTGDEALARLDSLRPDIVLADVVMPEPDGYEICRRIKASDRAVPVLLLAGTFEAFDHDLARSCGADGCLLKPFESRTLIDRVTSLLAERGAVTAAPLEPSLRETEDEAHDEPQAETPPNSDDPQALPGSPSPALPEGWTDETVKLIAHEVIRQLSSDAVREIAEAVVPGIAEAVVRERIRELEREDS